jgi:hypothetical protein
MEDVVQTIDTARRQLSAGHDKEAARLLTDAAYSTHDPVIEDQIRTVAEEGLAASGLFGRSKWREIIRIAELRGARGQG